jgi:hypothetical protein
MCDSRLYFQTASAPSWQRGHCRGTLVHGFVGVNFEAFANNSLTRLGQRDRGISMRVAPFQPFPLVRRMEQRVPVFKQNPQGLVSGKISASKRMWIAICWTSFAGFLRVRGVLRQRMQQHCSCPLRESPSSLQTKQAKPSQRYEYL